MDAIIWSAEKKNLRRKVEEGADSRSFFAKVWVFPTSKNSKIRQLYLPTIDPVLDACVML